MEKSTDVNSSQEGNVLSRSSNVQKRGLFRPVTTVNTDKISGKKTFSVRENFYYSGNIPIPPMPPPSLLSKFDRSSISKARESKLQAMTVTPPLFSASMPVPPSVSSSVSWKDAKKHELLFEDDCKQTRATNLSYRWYIEGEDKFT